MQSMILVIAAAAFSVSHSVQAAPDIDLSAYSVATVNGKVSGSVGACLMSHRDKPRVCFWTGAGDRQEAQIHVLHRLSHG